MDGSRDLTLLGLLFLAWSVAVAVSAHRRVRNVILASAGAAGVATGTFLVLLVLTAGQADEFVIVAFFVGLIASLVIALITWVAMKLGGWLPKAEDGDDPGREPPRG